LCPWFPYFLARVYFVGEERGDWGRNAGHAPRAGDAVALPRLVVHCVALVEEGLVPSFPNDKIDFV